MLVPRCTIEATEVDTDEFSGHYTAIRRARLSRQPIIPPEHLERVGFGLCSVSLPLALTLGLNSPGARSDPRQFPVLDRTAAKEREEELPP